MVNLLAIPPIQKSAGRTWRPWSWRTRDEMAIFRAKNMGKDGKMMKTRVDWGYTMVYPIFRQTQMCKNPSAACLLFCFISTSDVATKRSGDARKMTFFFSSRSNWRPKSIAVVTVQNCSAQNGIAYAATIAVLVLSHTTRPWQVTSRFLSPRRMRTIAQLKQGWNLAELHRSPLNWSLLRQPENLPSDFWWFWMIPSGKLT